VLRLAQSHEVAKDEIVVGADARRRADEWELLAFVADRPLMELFRPHLPTGLVRSVDLPRYKGRRIRTAGVVATGRFAHTERGVEMQFITLEDEWGLMEVTLFPGTCPLVAHLRLGPYLAVGVVDEQFGVFTGLKHGGNKSQRTKVALVLDHPRLQQGDRALVEFLGG